MIEADKGHTYYLEVYDYPGSALATLKFMKRKGDNYPGNKDSYAGTNTQEVLRACIARIKYFNNQIPDVNNELVLDHLRKAMFYLEERAARKHNKILGSVGDEIETLPVGRNGHLLIGAGEE